MSAHRWRPRGLALGLGAGLAMVLGASGCEDPRPGHAPEPATAAVSHAEREAARALLTQITAIATPPARADMLLHAIDVSALMALVVPPEVPFLSPGALLAATGELTDCLLSTGSAATLSECELGDHVIDGTWSLQYPAAHTELVDVFVVGPRDHGSLWIDARLTVADRVMDSLPDMPSVRGIDGDIEISLMWSADHREYALDASIHVDGLAVDSSAGPGAGSAGELALEQADEPGPRSVCALGGVVTIRGSVSTGDQSRVTVWLGPGCRDVHVVRSAGP
ncbi:MAG TPA: hypothetical protein VNM90_11955 [Haliangium sp.]|nr:hypothetical protein [Haliangium sp.]